MKLMDLEKRNLIKVGRSEWLKTSEEIKCYPIQFEMGRYLITRENKSLSIDAWKIIFVRRLVS